MSGHRERTAATTEPPPCGLGAVADDLADAALFLARRFTAGATMWCCSPPWPHHARHVTVEYVHPVIVGKQALPAVAVVDRDPVTAVTVAARPGDVLLAVSPARDVVVSEMMRQAPEWGLGTVWVGSGDRPAAGAADHVLWLDASLDSGSGDGDAPFDGRFILLYHVLWELTQVCLEHAGLLRPRPGRDSIAATDEPTGFLYPFLDAGEDDVGALLGDLARSADAKADESGRLLAVTLDACADVLEATASAVAERLGAGGRLFTFGNGGSSTDAAGLGALFTHPPRGRPLPARSLAADEAVLTALSNDIGFEVVFSRQLIAHARAGDVAVGISTSGTSANLLAAFAEARRRGVLTVGFAGYDGGAMAQCPDLDHLLVVRSQSIHRVQEVQSAIGHRLWSRAQTVLNGVEQEVAVG
ncbi:MAG: D-sedoheptulose-7-phosphate isomerase [Acidimicrobiales bacterium]